MSAELILILFLAGGLSVVFVTAWLVIDWRWRHSRESIERRVTGDDSAQQIILQPPPVGWAARFDRRFAQMVSRTGLDLDANMALAIIFFCGALLAIVVFLWRYHTDSWVAGPAFLIGAGVPVAFLLWRQQTWRRTLQGQLPDAFFLLARSLRAGRSVDQAFKLIGDQVRRRWHASSAACTGNWSWAWRSARSCRARRIGSAWSISTFSLRS